MLGEMMFHDSESTSGQRVAFSPAGPAHDLDLSGQLALGRPMIVATIDRPGTELVLKDSTNEAKIEQTTLLRVILPLKKDDVAKPK